MWSAIGAALTLGVLGAAHCATMCGGLANVSQLGRRRLAVVPAVPLALILSQNSGRIVSYSIAGALAGGAGAALGLRLEFSAWQLVLLALSGFVMISVGLLLAGFLPKRMSVERLGGPIWRRLEPIAKKILPIHTPTRAFAFGLIWGWLPCGLVYSALSVAAVSGSPLHGSLTMFAFGMGTLPMLTSMGMLAEKVAPFIRHAFVRRGAGVLIAAFGAFHLYVAGAQARHWGDDAAPKVCCHGHGPTKENVEK